MKCNKCGEVLSDFSGICYNCDKACSTTKLNNDEEEKYINFAPGNETRILEQNKYNIENNRAISRIRENTYETIEEKLEKEYNYEENEKKESLPFCIQEVKLTIPRNIKTFTITISVILVSVIFLKILSFLTEDQEKIFKKGMSQFSQGIFRTYRDGIDRGAPASFKKAFCKWNKNEDNAKISYLLAVSCYYDYLNLKVIGARNDPNRIKDDMDEMKFYLDKALKLKQKYPEAFYYRGLYYLEINNYSKAITEFNKCINSAGLIWKSEPEKQFKWSNAANIAKEEALKRSQEKENSVKIIPPIIAHFCRDFELIMDDKGRASIKDKNGNIIIRDKLCPPLPDEVSSN